MPIRFSGIPKEKAEEQFEKQQIIDALDNKWCHENKVILHRIKYSEDARKSLLSLIKRLEKEYGCSGFNQQVLS
jgi:hypothetical protein